MPIKSKKNKKKKTVAASHRVQRKVAPKESTSTQTTRRDERIELRTSSEIKSFIKEAADADHKALSAFMLESALKAATDILTEKRIFKLNAKQWVEFNDILDRPVTHKPNLAKLLNEKGIFD